MTEGDPKESGAGYPEEQPDEVAGEHQRKHDRKKDEKSGDEDRGTATGNPNNAGADEGGS
jgi:hypothetical protein